MFYRDMRHLSRWQLAIDGGPLEALSNGAAGYPSATFFLTGPGSSVYHNPTLSVIRKRTLGRGRGEDLHEKLTVLNSGREEIVIELSMAFDADFADLFEVKKQLIKTGTISRRVRGQAVELIYRREDFERRTIIHADGARLSQGSADFLLRLKPAESWSGTLRVSFEAVAPRERTGAAHELPSSKIERPHGVNHRDQMDAWLQAAPVVRASWEPSAHLRRSPGSCRTGAYTPGSPKGQQFRRQGCVVHSVFGRGAVTSYQALPFVPQLASATLQVLARRQAKAWDDFRDAEPGKILHELRFGELTYFQDWPQSPYYGSADSTPLFLILLDEYERWSGDTDLVAELEPQARAALDWLEHHGDLDGDCYLDTTPTLRAAWRTGLEDSGTPSCTPRGELARPASQLRTAGLCVRRADCTARLLGSCGHDDARRTG